MAVALANTLFFAVPLGEARDKVALYLVMTMAPFALLSPFVGPILDRTRGAYRVAIIGAGLGRGLLAVLLSSRTDRLTLYPLAFGLLVLSRIHGVSRSALVPRVAAAVTAIATCSPLGSWPAASAWPPTAARWAI
ncbi:MAG: hypothetical protein WKF96_25590 [Solirubrobacteraceae bacterium]